MQVFFIHQLQTLGEAASRVSRELRDANPDVPWGKMIGMRNALVRGYFAVRLDVIWDAVEHDLGPLQEQLERILLTNEEC